MLYHIVINSQTAGAKKMLEYLRTLDFAEVYQEMPNKVTKAAIQDARKGKHKAFSSVAALLADLDK